MLSANAKGAQPYLKHLPMGRLCPLNWRQHGLYSEVKWLGKERKNLGTLKDWAGLNVKQNKLVKVFHLPVYKCQCQNSKLYSTCKLFLMQNNKIQYLKLVKEVKICQTKSQ